MRVQVLAQAVQLASSSTSSDQKLRVPMPSTPDAEAHLLLRAMYSLSPESLLLRMELADLLPLARICHRFAVLQLLH